MNKLINLIGGQYDDFGQEDEGPGMMIYIIILLVLCCCCLSSSGVALFLMKDKIMPNEEKESFY